MSMVQRNADGLVIVRSATETYIDTAANFALDFGEPAPVLYPGSNDCVYEPDIRHTYTNGITIIGAGPVPWTAGDRYIANVHAAIVAQAARQPPPDPPPGA